MLPIVNKPVLKHEVFGQDRSISSMRVQDLQLELYLVNVEWSF